jgi:hypothetical protein
VPSGIEGKGLVRKRKEELNNSIAGRKKTSKGKDYAPNGLQSKTGKAGIVDIQGNPLLKSSRGRINRGRKASVPRTTEEPEPAKRRGTEGAACSETGILSA